MKFLGIVLICLLLYVVVRLHEIDNQLNAIQQQSTRSTAFAFPASTSAQSIAKEVVQQLATPPSFAFNFRGLGSTDLHGYQYVDLRMERYDGLATSLAVPAPEGIVASCQPNNEGGPFHGGELYLVHLAAIKGLLPNQTSFTLRYANARGQLEAKTFAVALDPGASGQQQARVTPQD